MSAPVLFDMATEPSFFARATLLLQEAQRSNILLGMMHWGNQGSANGEDCTSFNAPASAHCRDDKDGSKTMMLLPACKHQERSGQRRSCRMEVKERYHKRGHISVACPAGHNWVWCSDCCDCPDASAGCTSAQHWMERDSFDTGKRNHMQRHTVVEGDDNFPRVVEVVAGAAQVSSGAPSAAPKRKRTEPQPSPIDTAAKCTKSCESTSPTLPLVRSTNWSPATSQAHDLLLAASNKAAGSVSSATDSEASSGLSTPDSSSRNRSPVTLLQHSPVGTPPSITHDGGAAVGNSTSASYENATIILSCKHRAHSDRGKDGGCNLTVRPRAHKRGHLAVSCPEGHQYVWCSWCCDCSSKTGPGCTCSTHWMERDSFDTGKRNHMQRHNSCTSTSSTSTNNSTHTNSADLISDALSATWTTQLSATDASRMPKVCPTLLPSFTLFNLNCGIIKKKTCVSSDLPHKGMFASMGQAPAAPLVALAPLFHSSNIDALSGTSALEALAEIALRSLPMAV